MSGYFELVVARTLQNLGANVLIEQATTSGRRPDFLAEFSDGTVTVEAISPVVDAELVRRVAEQNPLLDLVEAAVPKGWTAWVWQLPTIGLNDSKSWFKRKLAERLSIGPPAPDATPMEIEEEFSSGSLVLELRPARPGHRRLEIQPSLAVWSDVQQRIVYAVDRKRRQVRAAETPVLLAINASGVSSELEHFDIALLGRHVEVMDSSRREVRKYFELSGEFTRPRPNPKPPTYAGALAFVDVGLRRVPDPVLYLHPRSDAVLPSALLELEVRTVGLSPARILAAPARRRGVTQGLGIGGATG